MFLVRRGPQVFERVVNRGRWLNFWAEFEDVAADALHRGPGLLDLGGDDQRRRRQQELGRDAATNAREGVNRNSGKQEKR